MAKKNLFGFGKEVTAPNISRHVETRKGWDIRYRGTNVDGERSYTAHKYGETIGYMFSLPKLRQSIDRAEEFLKRNPLSTPAQETLRDIYKTAVQAGETRAELQHALDSISELCEEALAS